MMQEKTICADEIPSIVQGWATNNFEPISMERKEKKELLTFTLDEIYTALEKIRMDKAVISSILSSCASLKSPEERVTMRQIDKIANTWAVMVDNKPVIILPYNEAERYSRFVCYEMRISSKKEGE